MDRQSDGRTGGQTHLLRCFSYTINFVIDIRCRAMPYRAVLYRAMPYRAVPYRGALTHTHSHTHAHTHRKMRSLSIKKVKKSQDRQFSGDERWQRGYIIR